MEIYNPESARKIYTALKRESHGTFPITATIGESGEVEGFVYGTYLQVPGCNGKIVHLSVEGSILIGTVWETIKKSIQQLLEQKELQAA